VALLRTLCESEGLSVVLITHDTSIAETAQRVVRMRDGRILEPSVEEEAVPAARMRSIS
jgi:ABC-type lipoprotein export system ATPase subunit